MVFRVRKVFGTFAKLAPDLSTGTQTSYYVSMHQCNIHVGLRSRQQYMMQHK